MLTLTLNDSKVFASSSMTLRFSSALSETFELRLLIAFVIDDGLKDASNVKPEFNVDRRETTLTLNKMLCSQLPWRLTLEMMSLLGVFYFPTLACGTRELLASFPVPLSSPVCPLYPYQRSANQSKTFQKSLERKVDNSFK
jgi:hypothetical protein